MTRTIAALTTLLALTAAAFAPPAGAFVEADMARLTTAVAAGEAVDCSACNLSYADLSGLDLSGADLSGAYMSGALFKDTVLRGAILDRADLSRTDLSGADLTGASMDDVRTISVRWCGTVMPDGAINDSRCE